MSEKEISFNTTNEAKQFNKPRIPAGEYEFKIADIKTSEDKSKNYFILDLADIKFEEKPVSLVWAAPVNEEYSPGTNVGKIFLSVGLELGTNVKASALIGLTGLCVVNDYAKSIPGQGTIVYSTIGELIIPIKKAEEPSQVDTDEAGIKEDSTM